MTLIHDPITPSYMFPLFTFPLPSNSKGDFGVNKRYSKERLQKNGNKWEKFPSGGPPSPQYGNTNVTKKLRFILHFRALGAFLVFNKMLTFWVQNLNCDVGIENPSLRETRFCYFPEEKTSLRVQIDQI